MARRARSRTRFWRWYRTVPILAMGLMLAIALTIEWTPAQVTRAILYPVRYDQQIDDSAARHGVDPYLVCAVIKCESDWNASASSSAGAVGLMQLMPDTADEVLSLGLVNGKAYPSSDLTDASVNIEYGCAYLAYLQRQLGSTDEVIAAYNAGIGKVESWTSGSSSSTDLSTLIEYPETKAYLARVKQALANYQALYPSGIENS
ncbi:MAG: lytic transglycosylase domain-containing protein [Atopobiaceae bacterium]|nr:lytic transglycosylase domain-containing protein [Atopobiaceae bacterium]